MGRSSGAPLLELVPAPEIRFDGLADVIVSNGQVWFLLYSSQPSIEDPMLMERVLVARCRTAVEVVPGAIQQTLVALGRNIICRTCTAPMAGEKFKLAS